MKKFRRKGFDAARRMPPLRHSDPGVPFDIRYSEVALWLTSRPEIMQVVFDLAHEHGDIVYDPATKKWRGVDYHGRT